MRRLRTGGGIILTTTEVGDNIIPMEEINRDYKRRIRPYEVREALKKMGKNKATGPDDIPIEI